jgi:hypothetical protein
LITENLSTLKIHKLTQEQYDRELEADRIDPSAMYLTPDEETDLSNYVTVDQLKNKADLDHTHEDLVSESSLNTAINGISDKIDAIVVPTKVSELVNDKNYLTSYTETDPTVPAWAKAASKPTYTASEVGADASGTASNLVSAHNTASNTHSDIREQISQLSTDKADKSAMTLGVHTDGFVYLFINGVPQGNGLDIKADVVEGDVFGYVDENNVIVLNGALAEGTYTIKYEMDDGSTVEIGNLVLDNNVYYSITNNLTNCTNSNNTVQMVEGGSYSATITANTTTQLTITLYPNCPLYISHNGTLEKVLQPIQFSPVVIGWE